MAGADALLTMLSLERIDRDLFRAPVTDTREAGRLFGGMVAAQALRAAMLTVEVDHHAHSLHGYFMRPGRPNMAVILDVDRDRDGRSFTTRRVVARQDGEVIFNLAASFHKDEPDGEYATPLPEGVPDPDDAIDVYRGPLEEHALAFPFEVRALPPTPPDERGRITSTRRIWARTRGPLPDDRDLHTCALAYLSDMGAVYAAAVAVGGTIGAVMGASLDHAVWFHRRARADEWILFDFHPVSNAGSRGLVQGTFHAADGRHLASMAQEALVRHLRS